MGLFEFLRQWQGSRLAAGITLSVVLHLMVVAAIVWGPPPFPKMAVKRGEPLIVELPSLPDSPPPGSPAAPAPAAPPPPSRPARPTPPRAVVAARPAPPAPRAPEPVRAPERRVESAPVPATPVPPAPDVPTVPAVPAAPTVPAPPSMAEPASPAPEGPPQTVQPPAPAGPLVAAVPPTAPTRPVPDIRSLRRGAGGAGGSGDGRAGIEGEPIPLDSDDPRYSDYLDQVRRRIRDKWGYPCVKNDTTRECEYKTAQLVLEFGIAKDGKVPFINVVRSSGYPIYDDYAVNAVKLADFPPIPDSFSKKGVPILATFSYVVQSSLTNILR